MNCYSFRAECLQDVLMFLGVVGEQVQIANCCMRQDPMFPDFEVELVVTCSLRELRSIARKGTDLHVIYDSLKLK